MSSRTDLGPDNTDKLLRAAANRARLAPLLSGAAVVFGLGILGLFFVQSGLLAALFPKAPSIPLTVEKPEQITGQYSRIAGFDNQKQPYELTAKKGYQDKDNSNLVHMEDIVGVFKKLSGKSYQMDSNSGLYDSKSKDMDLQGNVRIVQPGEFTATMDKAHVNVATKDLVSNVPVVVEMDQGTIHANGLKISNNGNNIVFLNGVKAHFEAAAKKGDEIQ